MKQKYLAALLVIAMCMCIDAPARGQSSGNPPLATLDIAIWPEYDRPAVLVIYKAQLAANVALPANILVRMPSSALEGKPHAVAGYDPAQGLLNIPYTVKPQDGGLLVSFTTAYPSFQLEFYDTLDLAAPERRYSLVWPGDMDAGNATLQIQEPFSAKGLRVSPPVEAGQRKDDGLVYYPANLGPLAAGQAVTIELTYTKLDPRTSVEALKLSAPTPTVPARSPGSFSLPPGILAGLAVGAGLIIAGIVWFVYSRWEPRKPEYLPAAARRDKRQPGSRAGQHAVPRSPREQRKRTRLEQHKPAEAGLCTECGRALSAADVFCPNCGTQRRAG